MKNPIENILTITHNTKNATSFNHQAVITDGTFNRIFFKVLILYKTKSHDKLYGHAHQYQYLIQNLNIQMLLVIILF